ncbi:MAG: hypothetical protein DME18_09215 [Verrucomicrobia bacterium]|nr:MAG: hypothetical protein DME18_09215 [Verrucomicrobiota bacterium]
MVSVRWRTFRRMMPAQMMPTSTNATKRNSAQNNSVSCGVMGGSAGPTPARTTGEKTSANPGWKSAHAGRLTWAGSDAGP